MFAGGNNMDCSFLLMKNILEIHLYSSATNNKTFIKSNEKMFGLNIID